MNTYTKFVIGIALISSVACSYSESCTHAKDDIMADSKILIEAVKKDDKKLVERTLRETKYDVKVLNQALYEAVQDGKTVMIDKLVAAGADASDPQVWKSVVKNGYHKAADQLKKLGARLDDIRIQTSQPVTVTVKDYVRKVGDRIADGAVALKDGTVHTFETVKEKCGNAYDTVKEKCGDMKDGIVDMKHDLSRKLDHKLENHHTLRKILGYKD